jgi:predicted nucleic acid-binding Zn ribbon protein
MKSKTYRCIADDECGTWFEVFNALWSEGSLVCPFCQGPVKAC